MRDKVVVITGVSSGIGATLFPHLWERGYAVVGVSRTIGDMNFPEGMVWVQGDVSEADTMRRAAEEAEGLGTLVAWVNNAGVIEDVPLHLISDERIDQTLDTNLRGTLIGMRAALKSFLHHRVPGTIINIGSIHGRGGFAGTPAYDSTKGGIESATRYAAAEYGHLGIRVNTVAPGAIRTEMLDKAIRESPDPVALERDFAALHPLNRLGESSEVASVVRFLLSEEASFISGATIPVDGGAAARVFAFPTRPDVPATFDQPQN